MSERLRGAFLPRLPADVRRPAYDPSALITGVVHLGVGAFVRAHQAAYTQPLLARDPRWGILGVSLRRADTRDALKPQDFLYTLSLRDGDGERLEVLGALTGIVVAPEDPAVVVARMAAPDVRIVSLTITEKGYHRDPASGELDEAAPEVRHDLRAPGRPASAVGLVLAALLARLAAGLSPFTVLSCDNVPHNGDVLHRLLSRYADLLEPGLGRWVEETVVSPNCMVDRIVPATTEADRTRVAARLTAEDAWPVVAEPFTQWVIEDRFALGRPAWEETGVQFVRDVRPYEAMKLRMLNGSHSTIAYLGQLAGWRTVADAMAEPALVHHVAALMDELSTTLHVPAHTDLAGYRAALLTRFRNPALEHKTAQIAMDGSQKLPLRLLGPARERLAAGRGVHRIALGVAAWMRFCQGRDERGGVLAIDDPLAGRLTSLARSTNDPAKLADTLLTISEIFPEELARAAEFRSQVVAALECLSTRGVKATLDAWGLV